jgi:hypothetical protein
VSRFRPSGDKFSVLDVTGWWLLSRGTVKNMVTTLGFEIANVVKSKVTICAKGMEGDRVCEAIVAKRIAEHGHSS